MSEKSEAKKLAKHIILGAIEDIEHLTITEIVFDSLDINNYSPDDDAEIDALVDEVSRLIAAARVKVKFDES